MIIAFVHTFHIVLIVHCTIAFAPYSIVHDNARMAELTFSTFPSTSNPQLDWIALKQEVYDAAQDRNILGFVLSDADFESQPGRQPGDRFKPKRKPKKLTEDEAKRPGKVALYSQDLAEYKEENKLMVDFRTALLKCLSAEDKILVGDPDQRGGTGSRTLKQIIAAMDEAYGAWNTDTIQQLVSTLTDGSLKISADTNIASYIATVKRIHRVAEDNYNTIPEPQKIQKLQLMLHKLGSKKLDSWLIMDDNKHPNLAKKNFDDFVARLKPFYATLSKETLRDHGYTAQAVDEQVLRQQIIKELIPQITEQVRKELGLVNEVKSTASVGKKRKQEKSTEDSVVRREFKFCDTHKYNTTHWGDECKKPKEGHNATLICEPVKRGKQA